MKTNCTCPEKSEEWEYDSSIGCWYLTRECEACEYYWEGPDYTKSDPLVHPTKGRTENVFYSASKEAEQGADAPGTFYIYCYDEQGRYGSPVKLIEVQDIFNFCEMNKHSHAAIRVVDPKEDAVVIEVLNSQFVFPEEWTRFNKAN